MQDILIIKLYTYVYTGISVISQVYLQSQIQNVGMTINAADQRLYVHNGHNVVRNSCQSLNQRQLLDPIVDLCKKMNFL